MVIVLLNWRDVFLIDYVKRMYFMGKCYKLNILFVIEENYFFVLCIFLFDVFNY